MRIVSLLVGGLLLLVMAQAQQASPGENSFSHFYFAIDSTAYQTLKTDSFCKYKLFHSNEGSANMDQGSWSGNYLTGLYDYWEVMKADPKNSIVEGSIGFGHILHRPQESYDLQAQWQSLTKDSIGHHYFTEKKGKDTVIIELMNYRDSMLSGGMACFFVMFYHPTIMRQAGFSQKTITEKGLNQETINKLSYGQSALGKKLYRRIEKITLRLTAAEFKRHAIALKALGYQQTGKFNFKKEIEVSIKVEKDPPQRLKEIVFSLNSAVPKRKILLSPHAFISIDGNNGRLVVN